MNTFYLTKIYKVIYLIVVLAIFMSCNDNGPDGGDQLLEDITIIEDYLASNSLNGTKVKDGVYEVNLSEGTGGEVMRERVTEISIFLRKLNTGQQFYADSSYTFLPNNGLYLEGVAGNYVGIRDVIVEMNIGDISDIYLASGYMFAASSGTFNGVTIDANQLVIARVKIIAQRTSEEQKIHENNLIKALIEDNLLTADSLESGVYRIIVEEGTGTDAVEENSLLNVDYKGSFLGGSEFDDGENYNTYLDDLIEGWQIGLLDLKEGSKVILYIPSKVAYGDTGVFTNNGLVAIPSFSPLVFEVTVNTIQ